MAAEQITENVTRTEKGKHFGNRAVVGQRSKFWESILGRDWLKSGLGAPDVTHFVTGVRLDRP